MTRREAIPAASGGDSELVAWLVGEVRNEGPGKICGLGILAFFFAPNNALVGFGGRETRRRMPAGAVWTYKIALRWLPIYAHLEVRAFPNTTSACPAEPLKVSDHDVSRVEKEAQHTFSYRARGAVTNLGGVRSSTPASASGSSMLAGG